MVDELFNYEQGNLHYRSVDIKFQENDHNHDAYVEKAGSIDGLYIVGRLAEYKYYDMDQIVLSAIETAETL